MGASERPDFSPDGKDRIQVVDLTEVKLMVVVDLSNRAMIYGSQKGMSAFLLRHVADSLEARLAGEQE